MGRPVGAGPEADRVPWSPIDADVGFEDLGEEAYAALAAEADRNLARWEARAPLLDRSLRAGLRRSGITRREFIKWTSVTTALLALPPMFEPRVARAAEVATRLPVIWQELQSCTGNSEALIKTSNPGIDDVILELLSLEYSEVLMAAAGHQAEAVLTSAMETHKGQYVAIFEGSVPTADDGRYLTIGAAGRTGAELTREIAANAQIVLTAGTCAAYGGLPMARPNPTGAMGVKDFLLKEGVRTPVINLPGCPVNAINVVGTILEVVMFGRVPQLDSFSRPSWAYGTRIHDKCERRGNFDAGEFVEGWSDIEGLKKGYCLYKVGCKGPFTYNNCGVVRFNQATSWPVQSGHGCIGCSEPAFWDAMTPFEQVTANFSYNTPTGTDATADQIGKWALGAAGVGIAAHATLTGIRASRERRADAANAAEGDAEGEE